MRESLIHRAHEGRRSRPSVVTMDPQGMKVCTLFYAIYSRIEFGYNMKANAFQFMLAPPRKAITLLNFFTRHGLGNDQLGLISFYFQMVSVHPVVDVFVK